MKKLEINELEERFVGKNNRDIWWNVIKILINLKAKKIEIKVRLSYSSLIKYSILLNSFLKKGDFKSWMKS
jgi:hypothetical protein